MVNSHTHSSNHANAKDGPITPYDEKVGARPAHTSFMDRIRASPLVQRILRTLQFLSSLVSLILFSIRLAKILRLANRASNSSGAVEGKRR